MTLRMTKRLAMDLRSFFLLFLILPAFPVSAATTACVGDCLHIPAIELSAASLSQGLTRISAQAQVLDQNGNASSARGAVVHGVWTRPNGSTFDQYAVVGNRLRVEFRLHTVGEYGEYRFSIVDVNKAGYGFDTNAGGTLEASFALINPDNILPTAVPNADTTGGGAPLTVNLSGSSSNDPDGAIVAYHWDFGDGSSADAADAAHTYTTPGIYDAVLTVTDDQGGSTSQRIAITVSSQDTPCTSRCLHVDRILMRAYRPLWGLNSSRVTAMVWIKDEINRTLKDVTVHCIWTMPDGSEVEQSRHIDPNSWKWFADMRVPAIQTGNYQLRITNIVADGYSFDAESSAILSVNITVSP